MEEDTRKKLGEGRLSELKDIQTLLVGTYTSSQKKEETSEHIQELKSLCDTYGLNPVVSVIAPLRKIEASTFLGKGKVEEISEICREKGINIVIFDDEISPQQQRNLEKIFERIVIDRTELILGVFAQRAQTKEAKLQVKLAQFKYQLPRLKRLWTHLERQRVSGKGGGYLKGMGERQIEIDRRLLRERITKLQNDLTEVQKHRVVQRKARVKKGVPTIAIVGYTNAGKSTLFKALTKEEVFIEDKLFATLDTTTRQIHLPGGQKVLFIDTVGFIRKIPTTLVAAFKSTLEEAIQTDILLHVIDASSPYALDQAKETKAILKELGAESRPVITAFNKVDKKLNMETIVKLRVAYPHTVEISAKTRMGMEELYHKIAETISHLRKTVCLKIPQSHYALVSLLMKEARVLSSEYVDNYVIIEAEIPAHLEHKVAMFEKKP